MSLQPPVLYPLTSGNGPVAIVAVDFNGDGKTDLAVYYYNNSTQPSVGVVILQGVGDGTVLSPQPVLTVANVSASPPCSMALGDFNGDGQPDLAVVSQLPGETYGVTILLNAGGGMFTSSLLLNTEDLSIGCLVTGDLNGDGKADLFGGAYSLLGNGEGAFQVVVSGVTGAYPAAVLDLNGDGVADAVVVDNNGGGSIATAIGNGDGTFSQLVLSTGYTAVAVGEFNGDGRTDLAIGSASSSGDTVPIYLGVAGTPVSITSTTLPNGVQGQSYSASLAATASGGVGGYTWTPQDIDGMSLSTTGLISGKPTNGGSFQFLAQAQDSAAGDYAASRTFSITIASLPVVTAATLPAATLGTMYAVTLAATSGTPPYGNWAVATGALPPGPEAERGDRGNLRNAHFFHRRSIQLCSLGAGQRGKHIQKPQLHNRGGTAGHHHDLAAGGHGGIALQPCGACDWRNAALQQLDSDGGSFACGVEAERGDGRDLRHSHNGQPVHLHRDCAGQRTSDHGAPTTLHRSWYAANAIRPSSRSRRTRARGTSVTFQCCLFGILTARERSERRAVADEHRLQHCQRVLRELASRRRTFFFILANNAGNGWVTPV